MDTSTVVELGTQALWITMLVSLVAMSITLAVVGGWQIATLVDYMRALFQRIPTLFT